MTGENQEQNIFLRLVTSGINVSESASCYYLAPGQEIVIGRGSSCQIVLDAETYPIISRLHAVIRTVLERNNAYTWLICDLNSTNGTFLNGIYLEGCQELHFGDRISLGANGPEFIFGNEFIVQPDIINVGSDDVLSSINEQRYYEMKPEFLTDTELHTQIQYRLIEEISESERRYRELVENLREIVFKCDKTGNLTLLNKSWTLTLGYTTSECLNHPIDDYLHAEDRQVWLDFLNQVHNKKNLACWELRFHHKSSEIIWLELSARAEALGEISGSLTNITDRKRAQAALKEANAALQMRIEQLRLENHERRQTEATLLQSREQLERKTKQVEATLQELKQTQAKLLHAEKMSSLGQLVAGIAHEINNPVNFIYGNINHANEYIQELLDLFYLYQQHYSVPVEEIQEKADKIDLDFLLTDLPKIMSSVQLGASRISEIVRSLRNFSRLDEADIKAVNIHEGIDSTLMILQSRLKEVKHSSPIQVIKEYGELPYVECYAGQLNQVFMNLLSNAIDAVVSRSKSEEIPYRISTEADEEIILFTPIIRIRTELVDEHYVEIRVIDNGIGMDKITRRQIFNPFFTTKPVGKGTGLGLAISYQIIVEKHGGVLECLSESGEGTEFLIHLPISLLR